MKSFIKNLTLFSAIFFIGLGAMTAQNFKNPPSNFKFKGIYGDHKIQTAEKTPKFLGEHETAHKRGKFVSEKDAHTFTIKYLKHNGKDAAVIQDKSTKKYLTVWKNNRVQVAYRDKYTIESIFYPVDNLIGKDGYVSFIPAEAEDHYLMSAYDLTLCEYIGKLRYAGKDRASFKIGAGGNAGSSSGPLSINGYIIADSDIKNVGPATVHPKIPAGWETPTIEQLEEMYNKHAKNGQGNFASAKYVSKTIKGGNYTWGLDFKTGKRVAVFINDNRLNSRAVKKN